MSKYHIVGLRNELKVQMAVLVGLRKYKRSEW